MGAFVAVALTLAMAGDRRAAPALVKPIDLDPILERLDSIETLLRSDVRASLESPPREPVAPESSTPASGIPHLATSEELQQLRERVEFLVRRFAAGAPAVPLQGRPSPDWIRLGQLYDLWLRDEAAARGEVFLLTVPQLVERYGMPTHAHNSPQNLWYQWPDGRQIGAHITDGYVLDLWGQR